MIKLKSESEIKTMARSGAITARTMEEVKTKVRSGITTLELDQIAENKIKQLGGESSFKKVEGYRHSICVSPNDRVVHGIPGNQVLKEGDVLGIDLGAFYDGFHSDMAETVIVGEDKRSARAFLDIGKKALEEALAQVKTGNRIGDISSTIQERIEGAGYSIVRELVGHGVGRDLHEDPLIPGRGKRGSGEKIVAGMVLAVEVIYNEGGHQVQLLEDGWTISTVDGSLSGLFERTIAVTKKGSVVLTQ